MVMPTTGLGRSAMPERYRATDWCRFARVTNVLAIDQGTSSTKALVVADGGRVLGESSAPVHPRAKSGGAVEQDPQELLDSIVEAGNGAIAAADAQIDAVGIANQGETVLRWDRETGKPFSAALSWQDRRAVSVTRGLAEHEERLTAANLSTG